MLDASVIATVKATAPAVAQHAEAITRRFYTLMFAGNPEVKAFFNQAHQHSGGQQRALAGAICAYAANIDNLGALGSAVELIAQKHASLGIKAEHYPIVGKHLLVAIKDVLGDAATPQILAAWGQAYGALADIFIQREGAIYQEQAALPGGWNGYRPFVVDRKVKESAVITSFHLKPADGKAIAPFKPGQYITVKIDHLTTPTSPRNYSLSDRPGLDHYRISVKRETGGTGCPMGLISNHLHDLVKEGDEILVGPPCGEFTLDPAKVDGQTIVLLSGGVGQTPVLAMLKALAHAKVSTPVHFIHAAVNSQTHAMRDEVLALAEKHANIQPHFVYSDAQPGDLQGGLCHSVGLVDEALLNHLLPSMKTPAAYYFCGPKPFMVNVYQTLKARGVEDAHLHFEFFGPRQDITGG